VHQPPRTAALWVGGTACTHSVLVPWVGEVQAWPVAALEDLTEAHFEQILALQPELVIFGSGARLRFPPGRPAAPADRAAHRRRDHGHAAACRTYNVLVSEGRAVVAALLVGLKPLAESWGVGLTRASSPMTL
jgi:uncharacterized protein